MEANRHSCDHAEEDYIYMEVDSHFPIFSHHHHYTTREFEFQMSSSSEKDAAPSPADELFYKGKLLPLHLPPRLQMVEKLLQNPSVFDHHYHHHHNMMKEEEEGSSTFFEESFSTPLFTTNNNTPNANNTPFESCNASPLESCQVSRELNPEEYSFEYSTEPSSSSSSSSCFVDENNKKSAWTKKLKLIKQSSSLGSKLKASKSYLKSFFNKTACSNESCAAAASKVNALDEHDQGSLLKSKDCGNKYVKVPRKIPFGQIDQKSNRHQQEITSNSRNRGFDKTESFDHETNGRGRHRRSFSGAFKIRMSTARASSSLSSSGSSSASSSNNSSGFREMPFFKRSNSVNSDAENPIQAAIAHCKRSQQLFSSRKTVSDLGFCSLNSSRVIYEDQRPGLCRG
ncbi:OLC1v1026584C1 [Oldenlandia corymbosa var. corymbosa]|uniref:OLC1v1026584C1 n=1 Tax=Oldenlandia corymbosa var. corymbosa TaxID=529605 RepID=A0AAV1CAD6_OLDCO|nr:OLC1v1026584C1 [Oldenlandia corymbosa var. corymbosa]